MLTHLIAYIAPHKRRITRAASIVAALCLWQVSGTLGMNAALFPPPTHVVHALITMVLHRGYMRDILASSIRLAVGYFAGASLGMVIGLLVGRVHVIDDLASPLIQMLRPISPISLIPIVILWFGLGNMAKYVLIMWGVFFPVWINTSLGVRNVDQRYIWAAQSLGISGLPLLLRIIFPAAMPMVIAGLRTAIPIAFYTLVAAELAGAYSGVAYEINVAQLNMRFGEMFAGLVVLGLMSALADYLFVVLSEKLFPWVHA